MKKILSTLFCVAAMAIAAHAQGTVNFANFGGGVNAPVKDVGGLVNVAGPAFRADLFYGPAGVTDASLLTPLGLSVGFNTGAGAGYFLGGAQTIPGFLQGAVVTLQVRAWSGGTSFNEATISSGGSNLLQITLAGGAVTPPNLLGLTGFTLVPVPEPSTFVLGGLGAAALLFLRRRK